MHACKPCSSYPLSVCCCCVSAAVPLGRPVPDDSTHPSSHCPSCDSGLSELTLEPFLAHAHCSCLAHAHVSCSASRRVGACGRVKVRRHVPRRCSERRDVALARARRARREATLSHRRLCARPPEAARQGRPAHPLEPRQGEDPHQRLGALLDAACLATAL
eukprot:6184498-Pleurochrysis_carterae.AAC.1